MSVNFLPNEVGCTVSYNALKCDQSDCELNPLKTYEISIHALCINNMLPKFQYTYYIIQNYVRNKL